jgi:DNA-binding transcriptional LysR family regulator
MLQTDLFSGVLPFVRTAEAKSFSRAASELGVTTAAVSKAVKKLEGELGVQLLERSSRQVSLTRAGETFLERCRQAVLTMQGAHEAVQASAKEPQGELRVTLPFILAPFVVPGIPGLSAQYPRLSFLLNMSDRLARIADERFDVALRMGGLGDSSLIARLLRRTRWVTVASPSYVARHGAPRTPGDLAGHNCLRFVAPNGKAPDWAFRDGARAVSADPGGNLLIDHGTWLLAAAEAGMGVCQALDFMVEAPLREGKLVEVLSGFSAPGPRIHALTTAGRAGSPNMRAFLRFAIDAFR